MKYIFASLILHYRFNIFKIILNRSYYELRTLKQTNDLF